jgi:hypothetical protein
MYSQLNDIGMMIACGTWLIVVMFVQVCFVILLAFSRKASKDKK